MDDFLRQSEPTAIQYPSNSGIYTAFVTGTTLLNSLQIPDIQRELDLEWVDELVSRLISEYQAKGFFDFGCFCLCYYQNELHLLNGQHRYEALKRIVEKGDYPNCQIKVEVREATTPEVMNTLWTISNSSRQVKPVKNSDHQLAINGLRRYLTKHHSPYISNAIKPHKPNINLDYLVEKIEEFGLLVEFPLSAQQLIENVTKINSYYSSVSYQLSIWKGWKIPDIENQLDKCRKKSPSDTLYLGIFNNFEWLQRIVIHLKDGIPYNEMPHYLITRQPRKISKHLRDLVWEKRNSGTNGQCYVCQSQLNFKDFQCGHIKAHFWGGESIKENLEPICGGCNRDMGVENLITYKNRQNGHNGHNRHI